MADPGEGKKGVSDRMMVFWFGADRILGKERKKSGNWRGGDNAGGGGGTLELSTVGSMGQKIGPMWG